MSERQLDEELGQIKLLTVNPAAEKLVREQLSSVYSVGQVANRYSKERPPASELMTPVNGQSPPTPIANSNSNRNASNLVNGSSKNGSSTKTTTNESVNYGIGYANGFESYPEEEGEFIEVKKPRMLFFVVNI